MPDFAKTVNAALIGCAVWLERPALIGNKIKALVGLKINAEMLQKSLTVESIQSKVMADKRRASNPKPAKNKMKTNITITDSKTNIASFEPVEGRFDINATSAEMEDVSTFDVEESIAAQLTEKHGFGVKVEIFQSNGRAITSETPSAGTFLATRK